MTRLVQTAGERRFGIPPVENREQSSAVYRVHPPLIVIPTRERSETGGIRFQRAQPLAFDFAAPTTLIHNPNVTSDLDAKNQRADHRQGGGGASRRRVRGSNSFVLKILTSKSLGLKILQTIFAKPAPVAAFRGVGGGGYPEICYFSVRAFGIEEPSGPRGGIFFCWFRYNKKQVP